MRHLSKVSDGVYQRLAALPFLKGPYGNFLPCRVVLASGRVLDRGHILRIDPDFHDAGLRETDALGYTWSTNPARPEYVSLEEIASLQPARDPGDKPSFYSYFDPAREAFLRNPQILQAMRLAPGLYEDLQRIEPAADGVRRPCRLVMKDGLTMEHVYAFPADDSLRPETSYAWMAEVLRIEASPDRLPKRFADKITAAGESGKETYEFALIFRDGRKLHAVSGYQVDFLRLPEGYSYENLADLIPHEGPEKKEKALETENPVHCPYWI